MAAKLENLPYRKHLPSRWWIVVSSLGMTYRHALWLIEHAPGHFNPRSLRPTDGDAYEKAKQMWLKNIEEQGDNPRVLWHAAEFFTFADEALAADILQRGAVLEPENPDWDARPSRLESREESAQ